MQIIILIYMSKPDPSVALPPFAITDEQIVITIAETGCYHWYLQYYSLKYRMHNVIITILKPAQMHHAYMCLYGVQ